MSDDNPYTQEVWRPVPIPGLESIYQVSSAGRVRNRSRVMALALHESKGYKHLRARFRFNGKQKGFRVHRLVLTAFVGPCPDGMECCHRDGDSLNNRIENLYWGTHSENEFDRVRHGSHPLANKTECKYGHEFTPENTIIRPEGWRDCRKCRQRWGRESYERRLRSRAAL